MSRSIALNLAATVAASTLVWFATPTVNAQAPLFHADSPLPPPCAAEGVCRPKRDTYGYYPTRWRRWSTDFSGQAPDQQSQESVLNPRPDIKPEEEDREAPPPSDKLEADDTGIGAEDLSLPPLPPALDRLPPADAGDGDDERPPLPPFPTRPPGASINRQGGRIANLPTASTVKLRWERSLDTPPKMPVGLPVANSRPPVLPASSGLQEIGAGGSRPLVPSSAAIAKPTPKRQVSTNNPRFDQAIRAASSSRPTAVNTARQAFYKPDSPPPFPVGALR